MRAILVGICLLLLISGCETTTGRAAQYLDRNSSERLWDNNPEERPMNFSPPTSTTLYSR
jgi:hypothetical protein